MIQVNVVEDKDIVRGSLEQIIDQNVDMECLQSFSNGEEALNSLLLKRPNIFIMDIDLREGGGRITGIECMLHIKKKYPDILVLMYTIFEDDEHLFEALATGADGYILKRDGVKRIVQSIRDAMDGGAPMSRSIAKRIIQSFRPKKRIIRPLKSDLTNRQIEILKLVESGKQNKQIAQELNIEEGTVKIHLHKIYKKLQVKNRIQAVKKYQDSLAKL